VSALGRGILRLFGWRYAGGFSDAPAQILIGAPHTSNWDAVLALSAAAGCGIGVDVFAKRQLFWGPLGWILRGLGGVPIDREQPGGLVGAAVAQLTSPHGAVVAVAPEGTRGPVDKWKTGFHRMAVAAGAPIAVLGIDWGRKEIALKGTFLASGDFETDLGVIGGLLAGVEAKHPERAFLPKRVEDRG